MEGVNTDHIEHFVPITCNGVGKFESSCGFDEGGKLGRWWKRSGKGSKGYQTVNSAFDWA